MYPCRFACQAWNRKNVNLHATHQIVFTHGRNRIVFLHLSELTTIRNESMVMGDHELLFAAEPVQLVFVTDYSMERYFENTRRSSETR
jgi:hypothetical protein